MTSPLFGSMVALLVVTARVGGLVMTAPIFSSPALPKVVRCAIALTLGFSAWAIFPQMVVVTQGGVGLLFIIGYVNVLKKVVMLDLRSHRHCIVKLLHHLRQVGEELHECYAKTT